MKPRQAVEIEWVDSGHDSGGWRGFKEARSAAKRPLTCHSAGWLLRENTHAVTIIHSQHSAHQVLGSLTIPRGAIVHLWKLERAK